MHRPTALVLTHRPLSLVQHCRYSFPKTCKSRKSRKFPTAEAQTLSPEFGFSSFWVGACLWRIVDWVCGHFVASGTSRVRWAHRFWVIERGPACAVLWEFELWIQGELLCGEHRSGYWEWHKRPQAIPGEQRPSLGKISSTAGIFVVIQHAGVVHIKKIKLTAREFD